MRHWAAGVLALWLACVSCAAAEFAPGTATPIDFGNDGFETDRPSLKLPVFVPTDYQPGKAFPLILFFHGAGGTPDTRLMEAVTHRKGYVIVGMEYLRNDERLMTDVEDQVRFNHHVMKKVSDKVTINPQQIFISGFSQGGFATSIYGMRATEVETYRGYLVMGGGLGWAGRPMAFMRREPVLVVHGDQDAVVPYARGQECAEVLRRVGADVTFITQEGVGHTLDVQRYGPDILQWLQKQAEDKRLIAWMQRARAADPGDLPEAIEYYRKVAAVASSDPLVAQAETRLAEIEAQAADALAKAQAAVDARRYDDAMRQLGDLRRAFDGTQAAADAADKLAQLRADPAVAQAFREAEAAENARKAQAALAKAEELIEAKDYPAALDALERVAKAYPETPAAKQARTKADGLGADPTIGPQLREATAARECKSWLMMARNLIASGKPQAAAIYLRKTIQTHPDTSYAEEARKLLEGQ